MCRGHGFEFLLVIGQLLLQHSKLVHKFPKHLLAERRQFVLLSLQDANDRLAKLRSEEHTSELQSRLHLVCRLLLEKKKKYRNSTPIRNITRTHTTYTQARPRTPSQT